MTRRKSVQVDKRSGPYQWTHRIPTEEQEQRWLIEWADITVRDGVRVGRHLLAIANGGARHKAEGGKLKAQGVRPGVPDLLLALPRRGYAGLWIELKRQRGGRLGQNQRAWADRLRASGYSVVVCCGWREAADAIESYLGEPADAAD